MLRKITIPLAAAAALAIVNLPAAQASGVDSGVHTQIVGGSQVAVGTYPFVAAIEVSNTRWLENGKRFSAQCTGTLISSQWVLTAAHCFHPFPLYVDAASITFPNASSAPARTAAKVYVNPAYMWGSQAVEGTAPDSATLHPNMWGPDMALIQLSSPVTGITPPKLAASSAADSSASLRSTAVIAGYGVVSDTPGSTTDQTHLKAGTLPISTDSDCGKYTMQGVASPLVNSAAQLCNIPALGGNSSNTCQGDSGGPLLVKASTTPTLIGVTSWGTGKNAGQLVPGTCGFGRVLDVFSRVSAQVGWISRKTGIDFTGKGSSAWVPATAPPTVLLKGITFNKDGSNTLTLSANSAGNSNVIRWVGARYAGTKLTSANYIRSTSYATSNTSSLKKTITLGGGVWKDGDCINLSIQGVGTGGNYGQWRFYNYKVTASGTGLSVAQTSCGYRLN